MTNRDDRLNGPEPVASGSRFSKHLPDEAQNAETAHLTRRDTMKRQAKQIKVKTIDEIIEGVPFIVRDMATFSKCTCVDMRDPGYWELVGRDFMEHFSRNKFGKTERYQWETRCPDGLNNLWIWSIA